MHVGCVHYRVKGQTLLIHQTFDVVPDTLHHARTFSRTVSGAQDFLLHRLNIPIQPLIFS
jgi:hypothetical protein